MICLDANAFYWYFGRDKLPMSESIPKFDVSKLKEFLDNCNDKSVTASAYMEMLVHFRDKPQTIRELINFREKKHIKIYNNLCEYVFKPNELSSYSLKNDDELMDYANELLKIKIEIETKFAYVFMQVVGILYANHCLNTDYNIDDCVKDNILKFLYQDMRKDFREEEYSELKTSLINGYNDDNKSQQYLKKKYIELLTQRCVITHIIIEAIKNINNNECDLYSLMCDVATDVKNNGFDENNTMKTISTTLNEDATFLRFAEEEIAKIFSKKGFTLHQSKYIVSMLKAWLERGKKLLKNDIFDMLCIAALDKNNTAPKFIYLITFDEAMVEFIKNTNHSNFKLIDQFYFHEKS